MLHARYIDDIVLAASCSVKELQYFINFVAKFNPSIKYTYTISDKTVTFLDIKMTIVNNNVKTCVHVKSTDSHIYLLFSSSHPPSCKYSISFSHLLRVKRCCSVNDDFFTIANQVGSHFFY